MTPKLLSILPVIIIIGATLPITTTSMMMSSARLAGQRILVTGAGRGIGRALALICSREGANVAILVRIICLHMMCHAYAMIDETRLYTMLFHALLYFRYNS